MTACMFLDEFNPSVKSSDQAIQGLLEKPVRAELKMTSPGAHTQERFYKVNDTEENKDEQ